MHRMPWHFNSVDSWIADLAVKLGRAKSTLDQKISHLQILADINPPLIRGERQHSHGRLVKGLAKLTLAAAGPTFLPPSLVVTLFSLKDPDPIHKAIVFQSSVGLRCGQMVRVQPQHVPNHESMLHPPFKKALHSLLLPINHVNPVVIDRFVKLGKDPHTPILNLTAAQYRSHFKRVCHDYGYKLTTHSARHTFVCVQTVLGTPLPIIGAHVVHKQPKRTTPQYQHDVGQEETLVVLRHPELFKPAQDPYQLGYSPAPQLLV